MGGTRQMAYMSRTGLRPEGLGRGERIRTSGLYVPNVALYQAKLHPAVLRRPRAGVLLSQSAIKKIDEPTEHIILAELRGPPIRADL